MGRLTARHRLRRRQGLSHRRANTGKGTTVGLALGIALLLIMTGRVAGPLASVGHFLLALMLLAGAFEVARERRRGLHLVYSAAVLLSLLAVASFFVSGRFVFGFLLGFAVWQLIRSAVRFDAFLDERAGEAEWADLNAGARPPPDRRASGPGRKTPPDAGSDSDRADP